MILRKSGYYDKNDKEITEGDTLYKDGWCQGFYKVKYGIGTYDSGVYTYVGFYLEDESGKTNGLGWIMLEKDEIEIK
ncbi:MAG: acetyltransferase [Bacilli bacterium]